MSRITAFFLVASMGFLATVSVAQEADVKSKLIGVWHGFAVEGKGENPDKGAVEIELTVTKDLVKAKQFKGKTILDLGEGAFLFDLDRKPFFLDGDKKLDNPNRKEVWLGIASLEGDVLKWCVGRKARPTDFQTGQGAFLLILKRKP